MLLPSLAVAYLPGWPAGAPSAPTETSCGWCPGLAEPCICRETQDVHDQSRGRQGEARRATCSGKPIGTQAAQYNELNTGDAGYV